MSQDEGRWPRAGSTGLGGTEEEPGSETQASRKLEEYAMLTSLGRYTSSGPKQKGGKGMNQAPIPAVQPICSLFNESHFVVFPVVDMFLISRSPCCPYPMNLYLLNLYLRGQRILALQGCTVQKVGYINRKRSKFHD